MQSPPTITELKQGVTLPASTLTAEASINENRFHGMRPPAFDLSEEKPWHRFAAHLFATGATSIKDVAAICEVSEPTVRNLLRQAWFQERVTKLIADNGGRDIMQLLKAEQFNSLVVMIEMRDDKKVPAPVRSGICRDILDRTLGKPVQRVEVRGETHSDDPVAEARQLQDELARSRERKQGE